MTKENPLGIIPFDAAEYLKDEAGIAEFLNASSEMNDPTVLLNALITVARARSMSQLAEASGLGRESLYKALKPGSHPRYDTVMKVISALGVEMVFRAPAKRVTKVKHVHVEVAASRPKQKTVEVAASKPKHKASPRSGAAEVRATANGTSQEAAAKARVTRRSTP